MIRLLNGDCLEVLAGMPPESIDACVTDPPYHLTSIVKRFGADGAAPLKGEGAYQRGTAGFMGKTWDGGDIAFRPETWAAVLRVLKPGAHLVAFGAPKNYHRLACAIEDAGFEIRDSLMWLFGSGFPKSHDVSKGIDKRGGSIPWQAEFAGHLRAVKPKSLSAAEINAAIANGSKSNFWGHFIDSKSQPLLPTLEQYRKLRELLPIDPVWDEQFLGEAEREVVGQKTSGIANKDEGARHTIGASSSVVVDITAPATPEAAKWDGWGTALKPAFEPIILARKPLIGTVAANVLAHGTGAINVDATRIHADDAKGYAYSVARTMPGAGQNATGERKQQGVVFEGHTKDGRWPANVVHDGSDEVLAGFPVTKSGAWNGHRNEVGHAGDSGSAARFFYCAKASKADRAGSKHPTVKPIALMRWLCRLVTPPGGMILDPFAGSGTTGQAAQEEGFGAVLIEREAEYQADIRKRLHLLPAEIEEALA